MNPTHHFRRTARLSVVGATLVFVTLAFSAPARGDEAQPPKGRNPQAVQEVKSGARKVANAAWWGFKPYHTGGFSRHTLEA